MGDNTAVSCYHPYMVAFRKHAPARMTLPEFLSWDAADPSGVPWQLVDGEPVAMAPGSETHAALQGEIGALLRNHLIAQGSPCRLLSQPGIVPRVRANRNFRIPDLGVTCAPPSQGLMVPDPILLIEILSPSNEAQTRANIWAYTTIPSVREILAVHSTRIEAELLRRNGDDSWPEEPDMVTGLGALHLSSIGFTTTLAAFYRTTALAL
ncbi:MAG TPA: Uma2 family endonuclease [Rhodopila sp.]|jgi:Uma2 family endonuclease